MKTPSLGGQELELLRCIADRGSLSVADLAESFGQAHGLARTTIHTMLERLRKKGYLLRVKEQGIYRYSATVAQTELLTDLVRQFFQRTLGGSLNPFVAYLTTASDLDANELRALRAVLETLDAQGEGTHES